MCHNVTIAIDAARNLYNGNPSFVGMAIDALAIAPGARALHIGAGTGYYSALIGGCVGPSGRVLAIEADEALAARAHANLASMPWIETRHGDGMSAFGESFDAILVNAGVTHPPDIWLDALAPAGRMILPLTATMSPLGPTAPMTNIGKGLLVLVTDTESSLAARMVTFVAIFNAVGARDESLNAELGRALQKAPFPALKRLRRDAHEPVDTCWFHGSTFCLSTT